jgi:hypothetical protein
VIRTELHDSVATDFVYSIVGRIIVEPESRGKEEAGHSEAEIVLVTARVLAARQHWCLLAQLIAKGV